MTDKFGYNTVYTATITITPKTNYTVKGIAENGYTVSGAETVTNEADSATVTVVYSATENKNSNEFTQPLAITGWTYGETANTPTAEAKYGNNKIYIFKYGRRNVYRRSSDKCRYILCKSNG